MYQRGQVRHNQDRRRQHQLEQKDVEQDLLTAELHPRERISGQADGHQLDDQSAGDQNERIQEPDDPVSILNGIFELVRCRDRIW